MQVRATPAASVDFATTNSVALDLVIQSDIIDTLTKRDFRHS
jgi:hypothetical protein